MSPSEADIAWAAGLLEGEGSFFIREQGSETCRSRMTVKVEMSDEDVIRRIAALFGRSSSNVTTFQPKKDGWSRTWSKQWNGTEAEKVMCAVLPYMGERRAAKIRECLATPNLSHHPRPRNYTKYDRKD